MKRAPTQTTLLLGCAALALCLLTACVASIVTGGDGGPDPDADTSPCTGVVCPPGQSCQNGRCAGEADGDADGDVDGDADGDVDGDADGDADGDPCGGGCPAGQECRDGRCVDVAVDGDGDGYGDDEDCDDDDPDVHPGATELCNGVDDDCNDVIDDGLAGDTYELNDSCGAATRLGTLYSVDSGSERSSLTITPNLYPAGDIDIFRVDFVENDDSCGCSFPSTSEDYAVIASLTVPADGGIYELCNSESGACDTSSCITVWPGTTGEMEDWLSGCCSPIGCEDTGTWWISVSLLEGTDFDCREYTLALNTERGCR